MSFLDKILGRKNKQIINEPKHEIMESPPDELMTTPAKDQLPADSVKREVISNKDSPT